MPEPQELTPAAPLPGLGFPGDTAVPATPRPAPRRPADPLTIQKDPHGGLNLIDPEDILAPVRGIEGLVRSIGDLAGLIPGVDDPGFSEGPRIFGRSKSLVGGFLEVATQVAIPYAAFSKALGAAGFLGRGLSSAGAESAVGYAQRLGLLGRSAGRALAAGAAADFVAFDGNEERLSNLIQQVPALQNPISAYLQADQSDSEAEGRLKNALEGLGLGAIVEGLTGAFRATRAYRRALADGADSAQALEAARQAAPKEDVIRAFAEEVDKIERRAAEGDVPETLARTLSPE
ncbi:MAG TPA: hypothetical protein VJ997_14615, partial [Longimicrobiales bacterium]|nr:hypothetical protein [Longimicrobiales bacterium]